MFSILSHDMLSPLGGLKNMVEFYHNGTFSQEDFKAYTVTLRQNLDTLIKVTRDILSWSYTQLQDKTALIEPLDIHKIIQEQFEVYALAAQDKAITLINSVPPDFRLNADYNQMNLITRNLIDNAIKYTNKNGIVEVTTLNTEGGRKLIFKDNGKGMSAEKVKNLFMIKHLNDAKNTSKSKSVYLGLEMVYDLVQKNKFDISVESRENEGSIFTISSKINE